MNDAADSARQQSQQEQPKQPQPHGELVASPASEETLTLLARGTLSVRGQIREASNAVLFGTVEHEGRRVPCVYKPVAGERPLWDFPDGTLAQREVAAYEISRVTGWDLIPATVLRTGPYGEGMCQAWVGPQPEAAPGDETDAAEVTAGAEDADADADGDGERDGEDAEGDGDEPHGAGQLLAIVEGDEPGEGWKPVGHVDTGTARPALLVHADDERLRRLAVIDAVVNNGDRKGGHLLTLPTGELYAIDHGVTFHVDDKLRTLLWGWAGEELTPEATAALRRLAAALAEGAPLAVRLSELITAAELEALRKRVDGLISSGRHPLPSGDWPAIPWPPV